MDVAGEHTQDYVNDAFWLASFFSWCLDDSLSLLPSWILGFQPVVSQDGGHKKFIRFFVYSAVIMLQPLWFSGICSKYI